MWEVLKAALTKNRWNTAARPLVPINRLPCFGTKRRYATSRSPPVATRNIGIIAHIDAGKTTTTERMLYFAGITKQIGNVDSGDTITDYLPAERERGITIQSAAISFDWQKTRINLIDTPGHADFTFEVIRSLRILDGAVVILDAVAGVEAQTETVWEQANKLAIPRLLYINKMDRPGAGFGRTIREIIARLHTRVAMLTIPYFDGDKFSGVIDVLDEKVIIWHGRDGKKVEVCEPKDKQLETEVASAKTGLVDTLAELDEEVVAEYLEKEDASQVSKETLKKSIRAATLRNEICPVVCGSSFRNVGVQPLLDAIVSYLPAPEERPVPAVTINGESKSLEADCVCALAFKVQHHPTKGVLVYVRVYSGSIKRFSTLYNTNTGSKEKVAQLYQMQADKPIEISAISVGQIGVIVGTTNTRTGDTLVGSQTRPNSTNSLSRKEKSLVLLPIEVPAPVFVARIIPKSVSDQRAMSAALDILLKEDPSLDLSFDEEAGQWLLAGMGELHLLIAKDRLVNELKAAVEVGDVMITYQETISDPTTASAVSENPENGGSISVSVDIRPITEDVDGLPLPDGNILSVRVKKPQSSFVSVSDVVRASEVGVLPVLARGGKIGNHRLQGLAFTVDVQLSPECTSAENVAPQVREAARTALDALPLSDYILLEPMMKVTVTAPQADVGTIITDISGTRRGHVLGIGDMMADESDKFRQMAEKVYTPTDHTLYLSKHEDTNVRLTSIYALVPLRFMLGYLSSLRGMTQGRGNFNMVFERYEPVSLQDFDRLV